MDNCPTNGTAALTTACGMYTILAGRLCAGQTVYVGGGSNFITWSASQSVWLLGPADSATPGCPSASTALATLAAVPRSATILATNAPWMQTGTNAALPIVVAGTALPGCSLNGTAATAYVSPAKAAPGSSPASSSSLSFLRTASGGFKQIYIIIAAAGGGGLLLCLATTVFCVCRRKRRRAAAAKAGNAAAPSAEQQA